MAQTIPIIVSEAMSGGPTKSILGGALESVVQDIPIETLKANLRNLLTGLGSAVENLPGPSDFHLQELTVQVEVSATGQLSVIGTGAAATGKGGLTLKFVRS